MCAVRFEEGLINLLQLIKMPKMCEQEGCKRKGVSLTGHFIIRLNTTGVPFSDHKKTLDIDQLNKEFMNPRLSLWDSLESSQWFPHDVIEAH